MHLPAHQPAGILPAGTLPRRPPSRSRAGHFVKPAAREVTPAAAQVTSVHTRRLARVEDGQLLLAVPDSGRVLYCCITAVHARYPAPRTPAVHPARPAGRAGWSPGLASWSPPSPRALYRARVVFPGYTTTPGYTTRVHHPTTHHRYTTGYTTSGTPPMQHPGFPGFPGFPGLPCPTLPCPTTPPWLPCPYPACTLPDTLPWLPCPVHHPGTPPSAHPSSTPGRHPAIRPGVLTSLRERRSRRPCPGLKEASRETHGRSRPC